MKTTKTILFVIAILLITIIAAKAQKSIVTPDLSKVHDISVWTKVNREVTFDDVIFMNAQQNDGLLYLNDLEFSNGTIELDIKGKNSPGQSFVGVAFHGLNESTFDAVYFRPFNFKNPERNSHSAQYISMPDNDWSKLRSQFPGKFENTVSPVPDPDDWFHARVVIKYPKVEVFVNNSESPSLVIQQISERKKGWVGFWTGNNSEGNFKNLKITPDSK